MFSVYNCAVNFLDLQLQMIHVSTFILRCSEADKTGLHFSKSLTGPSRHAQLSVYVGGPAELFSTGFMVLQLGVQVIYLVNY